MSSATTLVLLAVTSGEDIASAIDRAARVFGETCRPQMEETIATAPMEAVPTTAKLEIARPRQIPDWLGVTTLVYVATAAIGVTLAAVALVVPSATEVGLAGW